MVAYLLAAFVGCCGTHVRELRWTRQAGRMALSAILGTSFARGSGPPPVARYLSQNQFCLQAVGLKRVTDKIDVFGPTRERSQFQPRLLRSGERGRARPLSR